MASDEPSGARPAPVVLRIKLRYDDVDAMVQRFAPNVGKSGLFLPTKSLQAVGAEVKFELRLANDTPVLVGLGRVKAAKAPDPANPKAAFGMAIELMRVTRESREVILKMLERRKTLGLPEVGIPLPADIDAARQLVDTSVKDAAATAIPAVATTTDSEPVRATPFTVESAAVLTAPRRNTGPLAIAKAHAVAPLEPEAPRKKRAPVSEVIERASGPIAVAVHVPGLDDDVDIGAVLARARALAGGDLDAELDALREMSAAPIEIGIEAASAELAKQLGGAAVRRDRSARWAPPPATISAPAVASAEPVVETPPIEAKAEPIAPAPPAVDAPPIEAKAEPEAEPEPEPVPSPEVVELRDSTPILDIEPDLDDEDAVDDEAHEVEPEQIADEIHQLVDADVEEVEHTQIGAMPMPSEAFEQHMFATEPGVTADLERSLDQHLAEAEAEADADNLGLASDAAAPEVPDEEQEIDDFEILAEADAEDADLLTAHGEQEASGARVSAAPPEPEQHEPTPLPAPAPYEEFADERAHIPARIRAQQRRLSSQHPIVRPAPARIEPEPDEPDDPEGDYAPESGFTPVPVFAPDVEFTPIPGPAPEPDARPSLSDFAARLDLSDEFEAVPEADAYEPPSAGVLALSELDQALGELDPRSVSAGHALAGFEDADGEPSQFDEPASYDPRDEDYDSESAFTHAGVLPPATLDFDAPPVEPPGAFQPMHAFDASDVSAPVPKMLAHPPGRAGKPAAAADSYDLETALEALDVDLDDLSIPHAKQEPDPPPAPRARRVSRVKPKRALPGRIETDIPINFDDDDD